MVGLNRGLIANKGSSVAQTLQKLPLLAGFAAELWGLWCMRPLASGSVDMAASEEAASLVY